MRHICDKIIEWMITCIIAFMVVAVCWQVFARYVLNDPSTITDEMLRFLLIWTTLIGGAYAYGKRKHLAINYFAKKLHEQARIKLDIFINAIVLVFAVVVLGFGGFNLLQTAEGMVSAVMGLPMLWIYSALLISAVLFVFYGIGFICDDLRSLRDCRK